MPRVNARRRFWRGKTLSGGRIADLPALQSTRRRRPPRGPWACAPVRPLSVARRAPRHVARRPSRTSWPTPGHRSAPCAAAACALRARPPQPRRSPAAVAASSSGQTTFAKRANERTCGRLLPSRNTRSAIWILPYPVCAWTFFPFAARPLLAPPLLPSAALVVAPSLATLRRASAAISPPPAALPPPLSRRRRPRSRPSSATTPLCQGARDNRASALPNADST